MRIRAAKEQANWQEACSPMADYMRYCREMQFTEEPDYDKILDMLRTNLIKEQLSTTLPSLSIATRCETCRANDHKDAKLKIDRIEEENSPVISSPSEPQINNQKHADNLALQLDNISLTSPDQYQESYSKQSYYLPTQTCSLTPSVKMSQSSVDNFSQHSSLENLKSNLSANMVLSSTKQTSSEAATEEDTESVKSCQHCRQQKHLMKSYFDEEFVCGEKLSWQLWREVIIWVYKQVNSVLILEYSGKSI